MSPEEKQERIRFLIEHEPEKIRAIARAMLQDVVDVIEKHDRAEA